LRHCLDCRYAWDYEPEPPEDEDDSHGAPPFS
jgi:hypothetical protein